jgi:aminoglycoside phosphotransferase (APT) family kinase protein
MVIATVINQFAREYFGPGVQVAVTPLRGGLQAQGICRALVHRRGKPIGSFVAKPFSGVAARELEVYRLLRATAQNHLAPALLGWRLTVQRRKQGYVFLEWVAAERRWPWRDLHSSSLVVEQLAALHRSDPAPFHTALAASWDYEGELVESSHVTLEAYRRAFFAGVRPGGRPMLPAFERLVSALPRLRRELMAFTGTALLHGDAHPGNVALKGTVALLLDWERARIGSPLEDISSWVHSLAFWEPEARRKHDTLFTRYRAARGHSPATLSREFRDACILAGACNALAGALRFHLAVLEDRKRSARQRFDSYRAAADWLRIIRLADICFGQQG